MHPDVENHVRTLRDLKIAQLAAEELDDTPREQLRPTSQYSSEHFYVRCLSVVVDWCLGREVRWRVFWRALL